MAIVIEITTLDHPGVAIFASLTEAQLRNRLSPADAMFIAESPKVIRVALDAGCEPLAPALREASYKRRCRRHNSPLSGHACLHRFARPPCRTDRLYTLTRGVLCAMRRPHMPDVSELCRDARR